MIFNKYIHIYIFKYITSVSYFCCPNFFLLTYLFSEFPFVLQKEIHFVCRIGVWKRKKKLILNLNDHFIVLSYAICHTYIDNNPINFNTRKLCQVLEN